jgi:16S rRNA G1207 methylase RsmC
MGRLYLIANARLPYENTTRDSFGNFRVENETHGYKFLWSVKNG